MVNFDSRSPIYLQVINEIKKQLALAEIKPGDKLPSSRELAVLYSINPNTASRVYKEMETMGMCFTKRGLGTFVTEDESMIRPIKQDMADGYIDVFIKSMSELGYNREQIIDILKNKEWDNGID